jgi:hypothetical protein
VEEAAASLLKALPCFFSDFLRNGRAKTVPGLILVQQPLNAEVKR